jgi:membrane-associated protease RseP (regulator of RpoE activity)
MAMTRKWFSLDKRPDLLLGSVVFVFLLFSLTMRPAMASEPAPSFTLSVEGSAIQLSSDGAPLNTILDAISHQAGINLRSTEQATEPIYCHLTNAPLVETLNKLLRNWNFAFIYKANGKGSYFPDTLWIISQNSHTRSIEPVRLVSTEGPADPPLEEHQKRFEKSALTTVFADSTKVLASFTAKNNFVLEDPVAKTKSTCVQISSLSPNSAIRELGLQENDLVVNINGQPVTSATELVEAMKKVSEQKKSIIRIERQHNDMIDPIYIETH